MQNAKFKIGLTGGNINIKRHSDIFVLGRARDAISSHKKMIESTL